LGLAETLYGEILKADPQHAQAWHWLGVVSGQVGRHETAVEYIGRALRLLPDLAEAHSNLAYFLWHQGKLQEAEACCRRALQLKPGYVEALDNLGSVLRDQGNLVQAESCYREALRLKPSSAKAHNNLGVVLEELGHLAQAEACFQEALRFNPSYAQAHINLGNIFFGQGRLDKALACLEQAGQIKPNDPLIASQRLGLLHYLPDYDAGDLFEEHRHWQQQSARKAEALFAEHLRWAARFGTPPACSLPARDRDPRRRLRLGYVSPDFRNHVLGYYSEGVIGAHDRRQFEVFCYAQVSPPDQRTERIKELADHWRSLLGLSDAQAAELILQDKIDVLIDLAGHTAGNRLGVFARKPAPVQVTHYGYSDTTGLAVMDYRLTDACCDPPGQTERFHTERLIRLPHVQWCYVPPSTPEVGPLPARTAGHITFGSFNNLCKVTEPMIGCWAKVLKNVPGSRFHLLTGAGAAGDDRVRRLFQARGISHDWLTLINKRPREAYFHFYHQVDLCLDTYPYNGCNTTADALWMGVPCITLAGANWVSRQGAAVLLQAGLDELVTSTPAAYIAAATALANDLPRLHAFRTHLRERLKLSPLMDVPAFTRDLESAYRQMWEAFCRTSSD
jgi:predicted O-linked N-acetylglucosamine transferase (SPINDLY family)